METWKEVNFENGTFDNVIVTCKSVRDFNDLKAELYEHYRGIVFDQRCQGKEPYQYEILLNKIDKVFQRIDEFKLIHIKNYLSSRYKLWRLKLFIQDHPLVFLKRLSLGLAVCSCAMLLGGNLVSFAANRVNPYSYPVITLNNSYWVDGQSFIDVRDKQDFLQKTINWIQGNASDDCILLDGGTLIHEYGMRYTVSYDHTHPGGTSCFSTVHLTNSQLKEMIQ